MIDKLKKINNDSRILETELYMQLQNDTVFEKISRLIFRLSKKNYPIWRKYITTIIERLKNGETPESIIADLEKLAEDTIYVRRSNFKTNLASIRKESGLTQAKLSEASGVNIRMIQHYEQGQKPINSAEALTVYKLAQALNCTVEDLLELNKQ
jgi:DNA-binding XRE family transcriptional regulator